MFNLTNRIQRLFNWIKTNHHNHQNSLILQEQSATVLNIEPNLSNQIHNDETNITTSFNTTVNQSTIQSTHMQHQLSNSLLNTSEITTAAPTQVNNALNNTSTNRNNRRHRRSRRHHRSSRSNNSNISRNSSMPSQNSSLSVNIFNSKRNERNILSASCAVFCIAILAVSLVEIRWFYVNGGGCNVNYVGVAHFFAPGRLEYQFEMSKVTKNEISVYTFSLPNGLSKFLC